MSNICSNHGKTNRPTRLLVKRVLLIAFVLSSWALPVEADERVPVIRRFSGNVTNLKLLMLAPNSNIITTQAQWKTLWSEWRPNQKPYPVDLDKILVLVETTPGPNRISTNLLERDSKGNLVYALAATEKAGPGFGYLIMVVDKSGIKSINGKPIGISPIKPIVKPTDPQPKSNPGKNQAKQPSNAKELIRVNMIGRIRTQFKSVGRETPSNVISANGIIWELDFDSSPKFSSETQNLNNSLVNVTGELSMERQRGARTARLRYIVKVESLKILQKSTDLAVIEVPSPSNVQPPTKPPTDNSTSVDPRMLNPPTQQTPKTPILRRATNFSEISLVTSDGQQQTILADGAIHYESKSRNISRDWTARPEEIEKLNQFVKNTDWDSVPKLTRADEGTENEIGYTISIKSPRFVRRIYIERSKISSQPQIESLFKILGEMAKSN